MNQLLSLLLILGIIVQPLAALASGGEGGGNSEHGSETTKEHQSPKEAAESGNGFANDGKDEGDDNGVNGKDNGDGSMHMEYHDRDGNKHEINIEREVEVLGGADGGFAIQRPDTTYRVTVREIPAAREANLKQTSEPKYDTPAKADAPSSQGQSTGPKEAPAPSRSTPDSPFKEQQGGFGDDFGKLRDFGNNVDHARPEPSHKDLPSRAELELEHLRMGAAAETGARITKDLFGQLDQADTRIDQAQKDFAPPPAETLINAGPDFAQPPALLTDTHAARTRVASELARLGGEQARSTPLNAIEQAITGGLIDEIGRVLTPKFVRLFFFLRSHKAELRAGTELAVDVAVVGFPVVNLVWGLANLASIAVTGNTILGTQINSVGGIAMLAFGAIAPTEIVGEVSLLIRRGTVEAGEAIAVAKAVPMPWAQTVEAGAESLRAGKGLFGASKLTGRSVLNSAQLKNLARFEQKTASGANAVEVRLIENNSVVFRTEIPGKVPGSKAIYEKLVDSDGKTVELFKTTYEPSGKIVHIKTKLENQKLELPNDLSR